MAKHKEELIIKVRDLADVGLSMKQASINLGITRSVVAYVARKNSVQFKGRAGFGCMSAEKQRAIAAMGGSSVPNEKRSFSQDRELARESGRKGGQNVAPENRSFSRDPVLASAAGRKGGHASFGGRSRAVAPVEFVA